jgi:polar amino acid transport system substrate-binding protein
MAVAVMSRTGKGDLISLAIAAALFLPGAVAAAELRFCVLASHMPMSSERESTGVDVDLARELASMLGRSPVIAWLPAAPGNFEQALAKGQCDVVPGALADSGTLAGPPLADVAFTRPYYAGAYWLVRKADAAPIKQLQQARDIRLAVEGDSIVAYTLRHRGLDVQIMFDAATIIESIATGQVGYGYLWGPIAAWQLRDNNSVVLAPEFEPEDRWNFALAVSKDRPGLLTELDAALTKLMKRGAIKELFRRYSIPYLRPGETVK